MKLRIVVIVATAAVIAMIWPAWSFYDSQDKLFRQRQNLKASILIDSLHRKSEVEDLMRLSRAEYKERQDVIALARARTKLERLRIELRMLKKKEAYIEKSSNLTKAVIDAIDVHLDSVHAALGRLPDNSPFYLIARKINPITGSQGSVYELAKTEISKILKTPSTAKFASYTDEETTVSVRDSVSSVFSWVDAQNAYGATVRKRYVCYFEKTDGRWNVVGAGFIEK